MLLWNLDIEGKLANGSRGQVIDYFPTSCYHHLLKQEVKKRKEKHKNGVKTIKSYNTSESSKNDAELEDSDESKKEHENWNANIQTTDRVKVDCDKNDSYDYSYIDPNLLEKVKEKIAVVSDKNIEFELKVIEKALTARVNNLPYVEFHNETRRLIFPKPFTKKLQGLGTATRWQIPLTLAWAMSIHKSQGMTIEYLSVNLNDCFACGQAYVACSRGRSLKTMYVKNFDVSKVKVNKEVNKFYKSLEENVPYTTTWRDTIEEFDQRVEHNRKVKGVMEKLYKEQRCLCGEQCVVRKVISNEHGNRGKWYIRCLVGKGPEHLFEFVRERQSADVDSKKEKFVILKPGIDGAIKDRLKGKRFVFTGIFPEIGGEIGLNIGKQKLKDMIESFGGVVISAISGKTDYLIVGDEPGAVKLQQAQTTKGLVKMDLCELKKLLLGEIKMKAPKKITSFFTSSKKHQKKVT